VRSGANVMKIDIKNNFKKILPDRILLLLKNVKYGNYLYFLNLLPIENNKIVVCNFFGNGYGDSGKYIVEEIINQGLKYDIVWLVKESKLNDEDFPEYVRIIKYGSLRALYEMATAKIWIDNTRKSFFPPKRKNQYYIQTWHASLGLKRLEKDAIKFLPKSYILTAKKDAQMCDLMIAGSNFRYEIYRDSFWFSGEILKSGTPRCDIYFKEPFNIIEKVYKTFGIPNHKKIILYAPTFRKNCGFDYTALDYSCIIDAFNKKIKSECVLIIRFHPNEAHVSNSINYSDTLINGSTYDDMQELLVASEVLITDYSSSMFEMAMQNKMCFLYVPDLMDYLQSNRELYFDFSELPFSTSESIEELKTNITEVDPCSYTEKIRRFNIQIESYEDGYASDRVVEKIKRVIESQ
jgi:CDP-glycerol glycerophosphotransferase